MLHDKDLLSIQEARSKVEKAYAAWLKYRAFTQEQVDAIVERMAAAARANARRLAELAVEETGYGNVKDKIAKNLLNADILPRRMRGMKTVGVLREIPEHKVVEIGVPVGVVAAILPTTNPTSTAIYKVLISLKAGNAIVLSPHPRANACTCHTAELLYRAALEAGAP
jgi:acyl-CoA reductase-like NAD-dependent aldehyde dehydrogenase